MRGGRGPGARGRQRGSVRSPPPGLSPWLQCWRIHGFPGETLLRPSGLESGRSGLAGHLQVVETPFPHEKRQVFTPPVFPAMGAPGQGWPSPPGVSWGDTQLFPAWHPHLQLCRPPGQGPGVHPLDRKFQAGEAGWAALPQQTDAQSSTPDSPLASGDAPASCPSAALCSPLLSPRP